jgi:hypothetical protein
MEDLLITKEMIFETITRPEIAKLMDIHVGSLHKVMNSPSTNPPEPIGKIANQLTYDKLAVLAWIKTKPLEKMVWEQSSQADKEPVFDPACVRFFLCGGVGNSRQHQHYQRLRESASRRPAQKKCHAAGNQD